MGVEEKTRDKSRKWMDGDIKHDTQLFELRARVHRMLIMYQEVP